MSEQDTPNEGQPAVAGPEGTPGSAEQAEQAQIDWEQRYQHLQPEYTRVTQEAAELRQQQELYDLLISTDDPDTRRQAAEALGYVLDDEDTQTQPDETDEDPLGQYDERLGRLEQTLTERDQAEAEAEYAAQVREVVDQQLDALELDEEDQDWVLAYAINALPITEDGLPDIRAGPPGVPGARDRTSAQLGAHQARPANLAARATSDRGSQPRRPPAAPGLHGPQAARTRAGRLAVAGAGPQPLPI